MIRTRLLDYRTDIDAGVVVAFAPFEPTADRACTHRRRDDAALASMMTDQRAARQREPILV